MVVVVPDPGLVDSKMQVSCASGKLFASTLPPDDVAHPVADQLLLPARFQYLLAPAPKVMPELPLQSPSLVPDAGAAAPAMVMSRKSTSVPENAAAVMVLVVPMVSDRQKCLIVAFVPAEKVRVPLTVWLAASDISFRPADVKPVKDKLLNVFAPLSVTVPAPVLVKETL